MLLHLDFQSLLAAGLVSRSWRSFARDHLIWRDLFHREQRWRIREDAPSLDSLGLPPSLPSSPPTNLRRLESRRAGQGDGDRKSVV